MIQFEIVVETILDRWTGCELCFRPDPENGCRKHMGARVPNSFDVRHPLSLFSAFSDRPAWVRRARKYTCRTEYPVLSFEFWVLGR